MGVIYKNQAVRINFNIGTATTNTSDMKLKYRKPYTINGTAIEGQSEEGEFTEVLVSNAVAGDVYVEVPNDVMTPNGEWVFWSYITTIDTNEFPGNPFTEYINIEGVQITNKDFVKTYLGITTTTNDNKIDALIPMYEQLYLRIRNAPWAKNYNQTTDELLPIYPPGSNVTIAEMIGYKISLGGSYDTLTHETTMSYSWTSDGKTSFGFPAGVIGQITRFVKGA